MLASPVLRKKIIPNVPGSRNKRRTEKCLSGVEVRRRLVAWTQGISEQQLRQKPDYSWLESSGMAGDMVTEEAGTDENLDLEGRCWRREGQINQGGGRMESRSHRPRHDGIAWGERSQKAWR